jgi:2-keto-4-pentenoate hydratase
MATTAEELRSSETALAQEISLARQQRRTIAGGRRLLDLDGAYRVQRQRFDGRPVVGAKIGLLSRIETAQLGDRVPVHGPVLPEMLLEEPGVDLGRFMQPRLKLELATVLSADVPSAASPGDAARALPGLFLSVDILDTVWEGYEFDPAEAVADGVAGGAFLLGEQLLPVDVAGELRLRVNGETVSAGSVADLGDPVTRIGWLAAELGGLCSGDLVFLGSPAPHVSAAPGTVLLEGPQGAILSAELRGEK